MNAVERLNAAIEKLEKLKSERGYIEHSGWLVEENANDRPAWNEPPEPFIPITNDELFVVSHRSIDAQLALLRYALKESGSPIFFFPLAGYDHHVLALADAILGES